MNIVSLPRSDRSAPRRVEALATLPVFFRLAGRRAVVAGGSDAAAWKAELLAACGAEVHVYAECLDTAFQSLTEQMAVIHHARSWSADALTDAALAVCDARTADEAAAFHRIAKAAGVPVNVIDKPAFCDFQFGSIVNRSPLVVSISTDGAAPILGQAIRRRIEALLPPALADWASLGREIRDTVARKLATGAQRRAFWERFVDRAFMSPPVAETTRELLDAVSSIAGSSNETRGRVTLIAVEAGDAELLTLKAVRALQAADVILFDARVPKEALELARREATRLPVTKRGGQGHVHHDDFCGLMMSLVESGKRVVCLGGGEPGFSRLINETSAWIETAGFPIASIPGDGLTREPYVSPVRNDCARAPQLAQAMNGKIRA